MTYNRAAIMKAAWVIVRRFAYLKGPLAAKLSRALKSVWWDAKQVARIAAHAAAQVARMAQCIRPAAEIRAAILELECKDSLRGSDWQRLDTLQSELRMALQAAA